MQEADLDRKSGGPSRAFARQERAPALSGATHARFNPTRKRLLFSGWMDDYLVINITPSVFGPQWQEMVQLARAT